jgi:hypothetical protein
VRWVSFVIVVFVLAQGCATKSASNTPPPAAEDSRLAIRNQGYSLLYELMSDEKDVSKLLIIKKENSDVGDLVKKIAQTCGAAAKQMEAFSKSDPHLHNQMDGLPRAEKETRDLISKTRAKELITKSGDKFELRILLTQSEALTYGAHLALVVQSHETDPARQKFLGDLSSQLQELHQSLIDLMHTRWRSPAK